MFEHHDSCFVHSQHQGFPPPFSCPFWYLPLAHFTPNQVSYDTDALLLDILCLRKRPPESVLESCAQLSIALAEASLTSGHQSPCDTAGLLRQLSHCCLLFLSCVTDKREMATYEILRLTGAWSEVCEGIPSARWKPFRFLCTVIWKAEDEPWRATLVRVSCAILLLLLLL
jgi:hypothetical protein